MITETNVVTGITTPRDYTAKELADIEASKPTPAQVADALTATAKAVLAAIDAKSIRSIREWAASQPTAPAILKAHEADAIIERAKIT